MLISTSAVFHNNNETNASSVWNLAHYSTIGVDHRDHLSSGPTLLAITIFVGFTLSGLFLLWRRYRYANRFIAYINHMCVCVYVWLTLICKYQRGDLPLHHAKPRSHSFGE